MAVVIRLTRGGAKKRPFYHIVAADSRRARDGRYIERLGYYNPIATGQEIPLFLEQDRITYWTQQGAKPSERVANLLKQFALGKLKAIPAVEQGLGKAKKVVAPVTASKKAPAEAKPKTVDSAKKAAATEVKAPESDKEAPAIEAKAPEAESSETSSTATPEETNDKTSQPGE
jgi:small subunit ribosomal protein S16